MTRTSTPAPFRGAVTLLSLLLLSWLSPFAPQAWAQGVPSGQGLVADSTELRVLREFYATTGGPQWRNQTNWLSGTTLADAGTWYGVGVSNGDVVRLDFYENNLRGTLPASLGGLRQLQKLVVAANQLTGGIPATIGQLRQLREIYLWQNQLSAPLPAALGQLDSLRIMGLQQNAFTGPIPPELGDLAHLVVLGLGTNRLVGPIPASLGKLTRLLQLDLFGNQLRGPIPATLGQLARLQKLSLAANQLTGPLPPELGQLKELEHLVLWQNAFQDSIPAAWGGMRRLAELGISQAQLIGRLPVGLGRLAQLQSLDLQNNALTGPLPDSLARCGRLVYVSFQTNQFTGPLPAGWGNLRGLTHLRLGSNRLRGSIPAAWGRLTKLLSLDLSYNTLSGSVPDSLGRCPELTYLTLGHNQLSGLLPAALGQARQLWLLDLADNRFSGPVPAAWGRLTGLRQLFLSRNRLSGPLPDSLGELRGLYLFLAAHNGLTGPVPATLRHLRELGTLDLSHNAFTGAVPDSLHAAYLLLDHNRFTALPASYGTLPGLQVLLVTDNDLTALPNFLAHPNQPDLSVWGTNNLLDFAAYEANQYPAQRGTTGLGWRYNDNGQRAPGPADTLQVSAGRAPVHPLNGAIGGAHNHYQWQREVGGQWVDLPGDTLTVRTWGTVVPADAGLYRTRVTNRWITGRTLYSRATYLDIIPYAPRARNRPDDTNTELTNPQLAIVTPMAALDATATAVSDINFVRSWAPRVAITDSVQVRQADVDSAAMSTTYLDGLGRPVQTVQRKASPNRLDVVQPQVYDALGREPKQYLPYTATADNLHSPQGYYYRAINDQTRFYSRTTPPGGGAGPLALDDVIQGIARTGRAFAESVFEASPLNRVVAQGAAGETWQVGNGHIVERTERPNTEVDSVLRFEPGYASGVIDPGYQGFYAPGELWGTDVADVHGPNELTAHGYRTIEWKDREGQVVLRQVEANRTGTPANLHSRWLRTAYAYDDFGRLRYVLQPEGVKAVLGALKAQPAQLVAGGTMPLAAAPFLFHYRYDGRGRQIAKQVPGTDGETLVVFDQLDRPVLSQDAAQRARREWAFTKYDPLGRVVFSGLVIRGDTAGQVTLQRLADADTATAHQYEQRTADGTAYPHFVTTNQSFPKLGQQGFGPGSVLSVTSYDDYNFDNDAAGVADATYNPSTDSQFPRGAAPIADALRTTGMTTRTKTRVLGVDPSDQKQAAWLVTTTFYDERGRPVQVQTTNARKGLDLLTTQLDFTGKVVQSVAVHEGPSHTPVTVAEFFTYDHTGRLLTTHQQLPGETQPALLARVAYNELGQATQKTMGTGRLTQQLDFAYNIRGWLTQLNDPYHPKADDLFNLSLHYEQGFSKGYEQYNGNLTGQTWRSSRDGVQRAYGYVYDPLNRLLQGDFVARNSSATATPNTAGLWKSEEDNYRLSFASYDDNGNLLTLRRRGLLANANHATTKQYGPVDELTYAYAGNRLQAVNDAVNTNQLPRPRGYEGAPTSLAGDFQESGTRLGQEYLYDANGNLTQDRNKGISGIVYNHLNLPRQIHFGLGADSIVFRYTAAGQKVAKLVYQTGKTKPQRTDYLGPYQYEDDSLRFFPHAEGRVLRFAQRDAARQWHVRYEREFTFKDHLGNLRLAYRAGQVRRLTATLEQDSTTHGRESQQFDSLSVSAPVAQNVSAAGSPSRNLAHTGVYAAKLNAGGNAPQPLGPLTQFAVQKGDTISVTAPGLYPQATNNNSFAFSLAAFVTSLLQPTPAGTPPGVDGARRGGLPLLQVGLSAATLTALRQLPGGVPKGYLRVLSFNEDSMLVDQRTVQLSAAALGNYETLQTGPLVVQQNGYVSVYVGNESAADVYFDDVTIEHRQGLQVQENQYDPFGLDLAGVSGAAVGLQLKNFYQFNGKENQLDLGLNWNHQDWRFYDYQIGQWHVVDPEIENGQESWTPYSFGYDNAIRYADANGRWPDGPGEGQRVWMRNVREGAKERVQEMGSTLLSAFTHPIEYQAKGGNALLSYIADGVIHPIDHQMQAVKGVANFLDNVTSPDNAVAGRTMGRFLTDAAAIILTDRVAGKLAGPCGCFTAGTGVSTRMGRKPIEQIQVGDSVWAYNERTRQTALRPVTHLFRYERDTVYVLHTATGEALRTTSDHPFYVRGQWVRVKRLRVGDSLVSQSGQRHVLRRIDRQPEHVTVYNFTVDELHTYFVGQNAILVHNVSCPGAVGSSAPQPKSTRFVAEADGTVHDVKPTMDRISSGGRNPHRNDGSVFKNKGGDLPAQAQGHYREYVHPTPGTNGPGAMRVVTGQDGKAWFSSDHYKTFTPIR